ncbi:hypothetical protein FRB95_012896 [Tulasnella sp. JGI-2019a]|nr:hypothetical protein FRB95_012896 [Tulasnella sp. JGI-2019a]
MEPLGTVFTGSRCPPRATLAVVLFDFVKLSTAILQDGGTILKERSVDEIFKPRLDRNAKEALAALRSVYTG